MLAVFLNKFHDSVELDAAEASCTLEDDGIEPKLGNLVFTLHASRERVAARFDRGTRRKTDIHRPAEPLASPIILLGYREERMVFRPSSMTRGWDRNRHSSKTYVLTQARLGAANAIEIRTGAGALALGRLEQAFFPRASAPAARRKRSGVRGFGIRARRLGHDDYRGDSVRGKIVLVLVLVVDHEPGEKDPESPFDGVVTSESSRDLRNTLYAQKAGHARPFAHCEYLSPTGRCRRGHVGERTGSSGAYETGRANGDLEPSCPGVSSGTRSRGRDGAR